MVELYLYLIKLLTTFPIGMGTFFFPQLLIREAKVSLIHSSNKG